MTWADGSESSALLTSATGDSSAVTEILDEARTRLGNDAERQLLAGLIERVLGAEDESDAKEAG